MEIDHIFICVAPGAPEAEVLNAFGLTEGTPNRHPGQGTGNRRFFFENAYIELLYLTDPAEIQSELTAPTHLYERFASKDGTVSPFGICFRPETEGDPSLPFPSFGYQPIYLPENLKIDIGNAPVNEPMWFFLSFASRPDQAVGEMRQPCEHAMGLREITSLQLRMPDTENYSEPALCAAHVHGVGVGKGNAHLMQIGFDHESRGQCHDFRPILPLVFKW